MQQIWISKAGPPETLKQQTSPDPIPRSGEVRIRVQACGVSFTDLLGRMGLDRNAPAPPFVPGLEVAGVIDLVAQGVPAFKEGDAVLALTHYGGYSDAICVPYRQVYKRLEWMRVEDAAALPVNYLTAYLALVVMGSMQAGDRVLVHNAGGGLGVAALDICRILGAETYGTASPEKHAFLQERGLKHPIDYRNFDYERVVMDLTGGRGVHMVLDSLGGVHWPKNYRLLMPTGRLVHLGLSSMAPGRTRSWLRYWRGAIMLPFYTPFRLMRDNKAIIGIDLQHLWGQANMLRPYLQQIITWYDDALFRPHVDATFPFADAPLAHHYLHNRKNKGKVLLIP
ncbi:MAG TPA: zinc-binding dehydrogenase [Chloroflexota bacterium]|nr:zinc-binding dehydrogenase [Chloroflexota bacterium]